MKGLSEAKVDKIMQACRTMQVSMNELLNW